jgi:hypothetical protein
LEIGVTRTPNEPVIGIGDVAAEGEGEAELCGPGDADDAGVDRGAVELGVLQAATNTTPNESNNTFVALVGSAGPQ